ncbi:MAG TPA: DHHA1 domain-containing protein [Terriglobales bacterium]|nr:DHHA1 domain-containing protein [Terriglobales bacterium]
MTHRLYYTAPDLLEFEGKVVDVVPPSGEEKRPAIVLDQTAFYPTSGGQVFDTGWISCDGGSEKYRVVEVAEREDGTILHFVEDGALPGQGTSLRGSIDAQRRRDHMQQHTGQHVISAAFERLFEMRTVSFHMGDETCTIGLETKAVSDEQAARAATLANEIIFEDRPVHIHFVTPAEARGMGVRKIPPVDREKLRLIDVRDFDLCACGGTHVHRTGQIGCILLRKREKVRQGVRVEFVCGRRALLIAGRDYAALTEAATVFSSHVWDVPQQVRKVLDEARAARKSSENLQEEIAELLAARMLSEAPLQGNVKVISQVFADRDLTFIKLLAQKLTRAGENAVALLGAASGAPALVFAQTPGAPFDMGVLMKEAVSAAGGRGGGTRDLAQGGAASTDRLQPTITAIAERVRSQILNGSART